MEQSPQIHQQEQQHVLHPDDGKQAPLEQIVTPEGAKLHIREKVLRPNSERIKAAIAAGAFAFSAAMPTDAEAGDKYGLEAFAKAVAVNVVNQKLSTTAAQIRITPNGPIVVPNANMQVAPELTMKPGVQEYLQAEGLQVSSSPMFIRVANNPSSGVAFEQDTRAVDIRRNATGLDISRYYMKGNIPYVKVTPIHTEIVIQNGVQQKSIVIGSGVESPVYIQK